MSKRPSLITTASAAKKAVEAKAAAGTALPAPPPPPPPPVPADPPRRDRALTDRSETTTIHIPSDDLALLRRVAVERAIREGGRPSVSNVLRALIDQHRAALEAEAQR